MGGFSQIVLDHFHHPRGASAWPDPSGEGWSGTLESGRYMRIQLHIDGATVAHASFATYCCVPVIAAGSLVCEWVLGKTPDQAAALTTETLQAWLGSLPPGREFCAQLAVDALHAALYQATRNQPSEIPHGT